MARTILYWAFFIAVSAGLHWAALERPWASAAPAERSRDLKGEIAALEAQVRALRGEIESRRESPPARDDARSAVDARAGGE